MQPYFTNSDLALKKRLFYSDEGLQARRVMRYAYFMTEIFNKALKRLCYNGDLLIDVIILITTSIVHAKPTKLLGG